jgi:hypothetical protein
VLNFSIGDMCFPTNLIRECVIFLEGRLTGYKYLLAHSELSIMPMEYLACVHPRKTSRPKTIRMTGPRLSLEFGSHSSQHPKKGSVVIQRVVASRVSNL